MKNVKRPMPFHVNEAFAGRGVQTDAIISWIRCEAGIGKESYDLLMAFDETNLYAIRGQEKVVAVKGAKKLSVSFTVFSYAEEPIKDVGKLAVERMVSSGRLVAKANGQLREKSRFPLGTAGKMDGFVRSFQAFVVDGKRDVVFMPDDEPFCPRCGTRYPEPERKICPRCLSRLSLTMRLVSFFKYYRWKIIGVLLLFIASTVFSLLSPYLGTKLLFDEVLPADGLYYGQIGLIVLLVFGVRLAGTGLGIIYGRTVAGVVPWVVYDLKVRIFSAMQDLSMGFYTSKQTGTLMARVNQDADNIYWFFVDGLPYTIVNVLSCIGVLGLMLWMDWQLALVIIITIPLIIVAFRFLWSMFRRIHHAVWTRTSKMSAQVSDSLNGQRFIKAFSKEAEETSRFRGISEGVYKAEVKLLNTEFTAFPLIRMVTVLGEVVVLALGGIKVIQGRMSVGTLLAFLAYMAMLYGPLDFLSWVSNWWSRCVDSAQRVFEIIDSKPDLADNEHPVHLDDIRGDIRVTDAYFEYEAGRPVIKDVTLSVQAGKMLGIVGKSGAGKSTIVNLMARLYDLKEGGITIDGIPVKDIAMEDLRKSIGIVSQEMYLFMGTIADNIRYARMDASMDEVIAAAKAASAHDFIIKLPDGYDTRIGSSGQDLSGGEKQRLSIARAIIQNPRILILDEATSSMDTETERSIQHSLARLQQGRTTIAIAHRLSTLRDADMLAVIDDGKIVEYGTHQELVKKKGQYYTLYRIQMEALKSIGIGE